MSNYLFRRAGRYNYRRRYPVAIALILGRTEFVKALDTADPIEAAIRARRVSVEFDNACSGAFAKSIHSMQNTSDEQNEVPAPSTNAETAAEVIASLPGVMRAMTESIITEQAINPRGWRNDAAWRKKALLAHANGEMPSSIQMHPTQARSALRALERVEAGQPMDLREKTPEQPEKQPASEVDLPDTGLSTQKLEAAFSEYEQGKTVRRVQIARRCAARCISLPCTQAEALGVKTRMVIYALHEQIRLFFLPFLECLNRRLVL
jgi:hypothetical protein